MGDRDKGGGVRGLQGTHERGIPLVDKEDWGLCFLWLREPHEHRHPTIDNGD